MVRILSSKSNLLCSFSSEVSSSRHCYSGVPQDSVLSPILLIIYALDLPDLFIIDRRIEVAVYVDDMKVCMSYHPSVEEMENLTSSFIFRIIAWANKWYIKRDLFTSCIMCLGRQGNNAGSCDEFKSKHSVKDLSNNTDNHLKSYSHTEQMITNAGSTKGDF